MGSKTKPFGIRDSNLTMKEVREGDQVHIQHVVDLWKLDLPSLTKIRTYSSKELQVRFKN